MDITMIGCLHGYYPKLEGGDLLIITGDITARDTDIEYSEIFQWISTQKYKKKVIIAGNHDNKINNYVNFPDHFEYLCDSGTEFEGLKIWGSPWSLLFKGINPKCKAFTGTEESMYEYFDRIPRDVDILITHQPAFGILDGIPIEDGSLYHVGSHALYNWLKYVGRPKLHVFSHIHEGYGKEEHFITYDDKMMISVNCSIMNAKYKPVNKPIRVIL